MTDTVRLLAAVVSGGCGSGGGSVGVVGVVGCGGGGRVPYGKFVYSDMPSCRIPRY